MPLTRIDQQILENAIKTYLYSLEYIDHTTNVVVVAPNRATHERAIHDDLVHSNPDRVKNGLASIQYWGNGRAGYAPHRTAKFQNNVTLDQIKSFQNLVRGGLHVPTLRQLKLLGMPMYSGMSFLSKILTFLDPTDHCVLDLRLSRITISGGGYPLDRLRAYTSIPITKGNSNVYVDWCGECRSISNMYYSSRYRAVDVERGFFHLIGTGGVGHASRIYHNWR